jgi:carbon storage regulator CsrA
VLVLSRRLNEKIVLPAISAKIVPVSIRPGVVRLGIEAPPEVAVLREELIVRDQATASVSGISGALGQSAEAKLQRLTELLRKRLKVTAAGLAELHEQLQAGLVREAENILAEISDDLQSLEQRVAHEIEKKPSQQKRFKALVVEDDCNERELLASCLRMGGVEVDTAGDGTDALDYLRARGRPDVVLLDMGMPRCDGPTAVRQIRGNPAFAGMKIFAISGHLPEEYAIETGPKGIDRWFRKPVDTTALLRDLGTC